MSFTFCSATLLRWQIISLEMTYFPGAFLFFSSLIAQFYSWMDNSDVVLRVGDCVCSCSLTFSSWKVPCLIIEDGVLWWRELFKSFSGYCELVMEALYVIAPVWLAVLCSASGDGLLCCLKYAVSQLLDAGVDVLAVVRVKFSAQHVSQALELGPVCLFVVPAGFLLMRDCLFCQCHFQLNMQVVTASQLGVNLPVTYLLDVFAGDIAK